MPELPIETVPSNLEVYEYTVKEVTKTEEDGSETVTKELVRTKVMSTAEWNNLVNYNNRLIKRMDREIESLSIELEIAQDELTGLGEDLELAAVIQTQIDDAEARKVSYQAALDTLIAEEEDVKVKYEVLAVEKEVKRKEREEKNKELTTALLKQS
jgi:hypothetical protein